MCTPASPTSRSPPLAYYERYLAPTPAAAPPAARTAAVISRPARPATGIRACVVGYDVAGRLHAQLLVEQGIQISAIDPKHQDLPKTHRDFGRSVTDLSRVLAAEIDLWTVCCPTTDHLPVLRAILERNPHARVLVEKPACQGHEVEQFAALLATHRNARVLVNDQYLHSQALPRLTRAVADYEPTAALDLIGITFTKDRSNDIAQGRFIDRTYGVLGYEWLHMLAVLRQLLPSDTIQHYLDSHPHHGEIWATYDPQLFVSALTVERHGLVVHEEVIADSPLRTSIRDATAKLLGPDPLPPPDLKPLRRVAAIAELLHAQQPKPAVQP